MSKPIFLILIPLILISLISIILKPNILGISIEPDKNAYSIAIFGDSMVDTMGEQLEYLQVSLRKRYPNITFYYYNYGKSSQNVAEGLARFHIPFDYKTHHFPGLSQLKPDIIIIGSFAYNPFYPHDRNRHWITLSQLVQEAKNMGSDVYMLAEIAPLKEDFGKGPHGVNWEESRAAEHANYIVEQLENAIYIAKDHLKVPLINAYYATRKDGRFGHKKYVDPNDGIHPSIAGHKLMAELIASKIKLR